MSLLTMLRTFLSQLSYFPKTLRLIWGAARHWTLAWFIFLVIQGVLPAATVYLTRQLVDGLVHIIGGRGTWEEVRPVVALTILMAAIMLFTELLNSVIDWIRSAQSEFVQDRISALIHQKSVSVDLAFYESPEYYDHLNRARTEASSRSIALLESGGSLLQNGITLLAMAAILIPYGSWIPPALLISTLPAFIVILYYDKQYHQWWKETTPDRRWAQYYDVMLTHSVTAPEIRLFGLAVPFQSAFQSLRQRLRNENLRLTRNRSLARLGAGAFALLVGGVTMAWMGWRAFMGLATLGDLALFYQAFNRGQFVLRDLLGNMGKIYTNSLFLGNLFEFLDLKAQVADPLHPIPVPATLNAGIHFGQVTFRYPGNQRPALDNFSLHIPPGQITAIVGPNGAGKSTLTKLLCRFYDPDNGEIEFDGVNIHDMALDELRRNIAVLLQMPVPYQATAGQNIAYGDLSVTPTPSDVQAAAAAAGAHEVISRLPQGYDTLLGKWFANGTELSAGEWQRIALARAFLRQAQIIILDEPTSFMDSWSEIDWFDRFRKLAEGRTSVVITHRFTLAMRADVIHVMSQGRIVESGSHRELLALNGLYAQSWKAQMEAIPADSCKCGTGGASDDDISDFIRLNRIGAIKP